MQDNKPWVEADFVRSLVGFIDGNGGTSDPIENRKHPGNSDLIYTMRRTGVIEAKATKHWKLGCKINLRHPLSADQRKFLRRHGRRGGLAFCAVMLASSCRGVSRAIFFRHDELELLDRASVERCEQEAAWAGRWPNPEPLLRSELIALLSGE